MTFSQDIKNRLTAMLDYTMARASEFGADVSMSARRLEDGNISYHVLIGDINDGLSARQATDTSRWFCTYKDGRAEVKE